MISILSTKKYFLSYIVLKIEIIGAKNYPAPKVTVTLSECLR
jgi:hypothetical protein